MWKLYRGFRAGRAVVHDFTYDSQCADDIHHNVDQGQSPESACRPCRILRMVDVFTSPTARRAIELLQRNDVGDGPSQLYAHA